TAMGESHNRSWNCGAEGKTDDPTVLALRNRQRRNFLVTLLLSQGVPMIVSGDELGRSQQGNNNVYCQDNELSWIDWDLQESNGILLDFTRQLIYFRRRHPVLRRRKWFQGQAIYGSGVEDLGWYNPDGAEMTEEQWNVGFAKAIGVFLNGEEILARGSQGERVIDESLYDFFNAHYELIEFSFPDNLQQYQWKLLIDTKEPNFVNTEIFFAGDQAVPVSARSIIVLRRF
ncbi:MAG: glycogen debranching enzyme, partial [Oscillatoriales cyanobacterium RM1_1_9]|nr:glycogen debranching enzyme [Oscillatoriales cyanobacterium RM1_1_9]